jgi:8-oxo-dGTP diphosphatase
MLIQNIKLSVDALIFTKGENPQLLLIKRGNEPFKDMWAFPGGFVDDDEDLEPAARRELEEETGLKVPALRQVHTFGKPGRDPRGRTVSVIYYGFIDEADSSIAGADDAADARWIPLKDIKELAFDHMEILEFALQTIKDELNR